jgi:hypothetical protein
MDQTKIVIFNQFCIKDPLVQDIMRQSGLTQHLENLSSRVNFESGGMPGWYVRHGANTLGIDNQGILGLGMHMPQTSHSISFEQASDRRCHDLMISHADRPWLVFWSGGVDSTVIVASMVRNMPKQDRERVTIVCNRASVAENPWFYREQILPNFRIQDNTALDITHALRHAYLFYGEPGDQIFSHWCSRWLYEDAWGWQPWHQNRDRIVNLITSRSNAHLAQWLWQATTDNIQSCDAPVETVFDWWWWISFNFCWAGARLRRLFGANHDIAFAERYHAQINWFDSVDYQIWSMTHNAPGDREDRGPGHSKHSAKVYIHSVDNNDFYYKFKTKTNSGWALPGEMPYIWAALTTDGRVLDLHKDLNEIRLLLPNHFVSPVRG